MSQTSIFNGRVLVPYAYGCYGYTRGGGKTWHGGIDLVGADDPTILMPYFYYANGDPKEISGTVVTARKVDRSTGNQTWEWGWYVCVKLDANQTPDAVNYLYFCHCACLLVKVGQKVKSGDALAIMGNTGNAAYNVPPYKHCHLEVRATATGRGLNPTAYSGTDNAAGTY
ncbi:M23 family metallopeptidase, partial [Subdoligranulum variabile]|uniref:M23 family metallopeptidase n=1 Tax=Subdoligranulum variabile TaxID=214851 RepID=UPI0026F184F4